MEDEVYNLVVKGNDLKTYIRRFQELATLCLTMVSDSEKMMEAFIGGLPRSIEGNVTASKPQTLEKAINIAQRLMDQVIKHNSAQETNDHKQKFEDKRNTTTNNNNNYPKDRNNNNHSNNRNNNNYQDNHNNNNRNNDYHQQQNRRHETFRTYTATNWYAGNRPLCERCTLHHIGPCIVKCLTCNRVASPDYVPALLGKTYSSSSNNSFGLVPIASPSLSVFHDDPYMKVMHVYYAKESLIPPPTIVPQSPKCNSQEFFLPKELLPPKKHGRDQSSSSTPTLPQEF
uniref:Reverse transcriptase domain-containing protein n=1 Tax=Tanacetum cinerariifolium TaxID=118510 RepID=A0A699IQW5_TANCI|nr:reverse transcriptase domain-containing protein [Tanacetum cinerariifolium]